MNPCQYCGKRRVGCHSECPEYADWKQLRDAQRDAAHMDKAHILDRAEYRKRSDNHRERKYARRRGSR